MATKKKVVKLKVDKVKAAAKRKELNAIHKKKTAKAAGTGNPALDRANAVAKKGKAAKVTKAIKVAATGGADVVKREKPANPQFFGRPKVQKVVDPAKVKAERNAQHESMMRVPWYAEHRAQSIELWVARRKAIAAKDQPAVDKINRKLEKINKEREKARADWKAAGGKIPPAVSVKAEKAKPKAAKKAKKITPKDEEPAGDATEPAGEGAGGEADYVDAGEAEQGSGADQSAE
jgi:hypothetical protein